MRRIAIIGVIALLLQAGGLLTAMRATGVADAAASLPTATPIKHLVVIFDENISFDHYFATYPMAANPAGESGFAAAPETPTVNGLTPALLTRNPNAVQPMRLDRVHALTCDQDHSYAAEQRAYDRGLVDRFVEETEGKASNDRQFCPPGTVMGYFDGNTVTALWTYAQGFAMSDNAYGTTFGPSTPGALHLAAASTASVICGPATDIYGSVPVCGAPPGPVTAGTGTGTLYGDSDPYYDDCSAGGPGDKRKTAALTEPNIGDLLNAANVTWGWFEGGFADCSAKHPLIAYDTAARVDPATDTTTSVTDYIAHHEPFQYYASTANPRHLPPSSVALIGHADQANHQYDLTDFWAAADAGNLPAVSFLKPPAYQDAHGGYSDPLDEQAFLVDALNRLQQLPEWGSTAVIITYDDSDGWYDHVLGPIINHSATSLDNGCGTVTNGASARCGYGPRLPYLVISPFAKRNYVDHAVIDQTSTTRFIEDNWLGGKRIGSGTFDTIAGPISGLFDFQHPRAAPPLLLDPLTGLPTANLATPAATEATPSPFVSPTADERR